MDESRSEGAAPGLITRERLVNLAEHATSRLLAECRESSGLDLDRSFLCGLLLTEHRGAVYTLPKAVEWLWEPGGFYPIVDLAVRGSLDERPPVVWLPCGWPRTTWLGDTWNDGFGSTRPWEGGFGPFRPVGWMVPSRFGSNPPTRWSTSEAMGRAWLDGSA